MDCSGQLPSGNTFRTLHVNFITCKRDSATHSVMDGFTFLLEHAIFRHPLNENASINQYEFCTFDCVGDNTKCAKNGEVYADVTYPYMPYLTPCSISFFSCDPTDQTCGPICTQYGSNKAVWPKEVPFEGGLSIKLV